MKLKLIANPAAGGDARSKIRQALDYLRENGCTVELVLTGAHGDAEKAAAAARGDRFDRIVAAGGYGAILGNGRLYGGHFSVTPDASLEEAALDVCVLLRPGRLSLLRNALTVVRGGRLAPPAAQLFKAIALTVRGEGIPVQVDGDHLGRVPMDFRAVAGELVMVLPRHRTL